MRKLIAGLAIGAVSSALAFAIGHAQLARTQELKLYDARLAWAARSAAPRQDIVLVEINDASLRDLEPLLGRWPWPRLTHASLINFIAQGQPKVIAYDVLFAEPDTRLSFQYGEHIVTGEASDDALAEAMRAAGNIVLLADAQFEGTTGELSWRPAEISESGYQGGAFVEKRPMFVPPLAPLMLAARALGHNRLVLDADGPARRIFPLLQSGDVVLPSFGLAAAIEAGAIDKSRVRYAAPDRFEIDGRQIALSRTWLRAEQRFQYPMMVRYEAPALYEDGRRPYPSFEARKVLLSAEQLAGGEKPEIDPSVFRDKLVFVGVTAEGIGDVFPPPFGDGKVPGIAFHAAIADNVLSRRGIDQAPVWLNFVVLFAPALVVGALAARMRLAAGVALSLVVMALLTVFSFALFTRGTWTFLAPPLLASSLSLFGGVAYQYFFEDREKRRVKQLFGRYVSRDVFDRLMANPALASLGGERRDMTVLFSDIRGFTSVSEESRPEDVVHQLNEYFSRMVDVVFRHGGTVDKFVGDMVMALFGAPVADARHADRAVAAAADMVKTLDALNEKWRAEGRPVLDIGIGINSGEMIAGNIGSERIMSYTVIGDAVNLGSRLESLNKDYGTRIIISAATRDRLTEPFNLHPLGAASVKGRRAAVDIFEVRV